MNLDNELALAHRLADSAGKIALRYFNSALTVENKADASPVTQADKEIEILLREGIEKAFPTHGIIGEEFGNVRETSPWQWVIDPIDGTRAFIAGQNTFTTLIALCKDGVPVLGIIEQPVKNERWAGIRGQETLFHSRVPPPAMNNYGQPETLAAATISTTSTLGYFKPAEAVAYEKLRSSCKYSHDGGDAYAYGRLSNGRLDIVADAGMKPYDCCALRPVIEGAGGVITDWQGNPLTLNSNGRVLAAINPILHKAALTILRTAA